MTVAFDGGSIPRATIAEVTRGVETEELSFADEVCTTYDQTTALYGLVPKLNSLSTLSRTENQGLAPGVEASVHGGEAGGTNYTCLAYPGAALITDEDRQQMAAYGEDLLEDRIRQARADSNLIVDAKLATVLASTTLNNQFDTVTDGAGEWDDAANSTPLEDIVAIQDLHAPGADCIIYGPETRRFLLKHPDCVAEFSNFSAGQLDHDGLKMVLSRKTGIPVEDIHEMRRLYNSAEKGASEATLAYLFTDGFWMGSKRDLILVDPRNAPGEPTNNITEVERQVRGRSFYVQHTRYIDVIRPTKGLGCTVTKVKTPA